MLVLDTVDESVCVDAHVTLVVDAHVTLAHVTLVPVLYGLSWQVIHCQTDSEIDRQTDRQAGRQRFSWSTTTICLLLIL